MPLFELFGDSSRRKLDSSQEKITDLSLIPESDFAELIWENGQLMMQGGQSSRGRKNPSLPSYYNSPSQSPKHSRDRVDASNNGDGNGISSSSGRFRTFGSCPNEFAAEMCDDEGDDDIVPWFNCPINDFLPDLSGITENLDSLKKNNNESNFHPRANDGVSQVPFPSHRPKGSEATGSGMTSTTSNAAAGAEDTNRFPNSGNNFVNFSHFSRPKFVNRSTACNNSVIPDSGPSDMERVVFSSKQEGPSAEMKHANGSKSMEANRTDQPPCSEGIRPKDVLKINGIRDENGGAGSSRDPQETVVASSVCSGNGLDGGASDDPICNLKRKSRDTYDSEAPSDDIGEDSVGLRKAGSARGNSSKRGRAAEVHNLSERRRRDRINEKMRALQELIPNCNKVDKASMLDEAIEYLKTLQIQVQIMSMGAGMYMPPPMMFPGGMHPAHIAQIQAMGVGMASGLGFRMGMVEPNSGMGSSGFPMMQIPPPPPPPMQGSTHFPSPYMSGHPAMHGAVLGTNYPVIGVPGPPMSMQRPPMIPFAGAAPVQRPASALHNNASMEPMAVAAATTTTASKEPMAIAADAAAVGCSTNPPPTQGQGRNGGGLERSPSVQFSMNPGDDSS